MFTENLALHKPAWQSSTWRPSFPGLSYTADRAVDGQYTGPCAESGVGQTTVEWRVDLGAVKNIHHVLINHNGKSILGILYFKVTRYYLKRIDVILIITISGINVG